MDFWAWRQLRNEAIKLSEDELERYIQVLADTIADLEGLELWKKDRKKNPIKELRLTLTLEWEVMEDELEHRHHLKNLRDSLKGWKKTPPPLDEEEETPKPE